MKTKTAFNILILFGLLLNVVACGKKSSDAANVSVTLGAIAGAGNVNGLILTGESDAGDTFSLATANPGGSIDIEIPKGNWHFKGVFWDGGSEPFDEAATVKCENFSKDLAPGQQDVQLIFSNAKCGASELAGGPFKNGNDFKQLRFVSCLNHGAVDIGTSTYVCNSTSKEFMSGVSTSFRIRFEGTDTTGLNPGMSSYETKCFTKSGSNTGTDSIHNGVFDTGIKIPVGGAVDIPMTILTFEEPNCGGDVDAFYPLPGGLREGGPLKVGEDFDGTYWSVVVLADNYLGTSTTPLMDLAPYFNCNSSKLGGCFDTQTTYVEHSDYRTMRENVWNLTGSPDGLESYSLAEPARGRSQNLSGAEIVITADAFGSTENGVQLNFVVGSVSGSAVNTTYSPGLKSLTVTYDEDVTKTNVAASVASITGFNAICEGGAACSVQMGGGGVSPVILKDGRNADRQRKNVGRLGEVTQMLGGGIASILDAVGVTTETQVCGNTDSFIYDYVEYDGNVTRFRVEIESPSPYYIPAHMGALDTTTQFQTSIEFYEDGVFAEAFSFNCDDNHGGGTSMRKVGMTKSFRNESSEISAHALYYDLRTLGAEMVESYGFYQDSDGDIGKSTESLKMSSSSDYSIFQTSSHQPNGGSDSFSLVVGTHNANGIKGYATHSGSSGGGTNFLGGTAFGCVTRTNGVTSGCNTPVLMSNASLLGTGGVLTWPWIMTQNAADESTDDLDSLIDSDFLLDIPGI